MRQMSALFERPHETGCMRESKPDWDRMSRLNTSLLAEFGPQGVSRVEFVTAFSEPFQFRVWLGTSTDEERERLTEDASVMSRIRRLAAVESLEDLLEGYSAESEETVDRDFQGSWFYRLR